MRTRSWQLGAMLLACVLSGCLSQQAEKVRQEEQKAASAEAPRVTAENGEVGVTLDSATVERIGLRVAAVTRTTRVEETELVAVIAPDPEAVSFVRAGIAGRLSVTDGEHWPRFGERVSAGAMLGTVGDARPITAPRRGLVTRVLAQPGELVQAGQELLELTDDEAPLVRVAWGPDLPAPPATLAFAARDGDARVRGTLVGPAPEADPLTRNPAWLYRVTGGWRGMRPGAAVTGYLAAAQGARRGVLVPASAVVQWDALTWAYVERAPGRFVRVRVPTDQPVPAGWLVASGFQPGDRVVTTGAGQLLSEEFRARIVVGEEVGE